MYKVEILSDAEFESLPYPEMEMSLGVADPATKTAYVRYTQSDAVNKYLINHELEHLIEGHGGEHSDHYRNGVYYKGFGEIFQSIIPLALSFIPGIGPAAGAGAGALFGAQGQKSAMKQQSSGQPGQGFSGFNQGMPSPEFRPSQTGPAAPNISTGPGQGASGGTGALGGQLAGSHVDKLRPDLTQEQGNQGNFSKGFYGGRVGR